MSEEKFKCAIEEAGRPGNNKRCNEQCDHCKLIAAKEKQK